MYFGINDYVLATQLLFPKSSGQSPKDLWGFPPEERLAHLLGEE